MLWNRWDRRLEWIDRSLWTQNRFLIRCRRARGRYWRFHRDLGHPQRGPGRYAEGREPGARFASAFSGVTPLGTAQIAWVNTGDNADHADNV